MASNRDISEQDPIVIAQQAERDLNSHEAKVGHVGLDRSNRHGKPISDSGAFVRNFPVLINADAKLALLTSAALESGVRADVENKFPGSTVVYGSAASGAGDNREIPDEEGGEINRATGRQTKAKDFEGVGGPEDKLEAAQAVRGGDDDVPGNVRQGGETRRP